LQIAARSPSFAAAHAKIAPDPPTVSSASSTSFSCCPNAGSTSPRNTRSGLASPSTSTSKSATGRRLPPPARVGCPRRLATGGVRRVEQVEALEDRVAVSRIRLRAELPELQLVLDLERGLPGVDEVRRVAAAFVVLLTLLVHGVVDVGREVDELLDVVLQRHGEPVLMRQLRATRIVVHVV